MTNILNFHELAKMALPTIKVTVVKKKAGLRPKFKKAFLAKTEQENALIPGQYLADRFPDVNR